VKIPERDLSPAGYSSEEICAVSLRLFFMDSPPGDKSVIDINDNIGIEKEPLDGSGKPGDVPAPYFIGSIRPPFRRTGSLSADSAIRTVMHLVFLLKNTVKGPHRSEINTFIKEQRNNMMRTQISVFRVGTDRKDLPPALRREFPRNPFRRPFPSVFQAVPFPPL
jgi:hypothetical protein